MRKISIAKFLVILATIPLIGLGLQLLFNASIMQSKLGLDVLNAVGFSAIRGAIGGLLLGSATMNLLGLINNDGSWLRSTALLMLIVAIARIIGAGIDGLSPGIIPPIALELVISAVCFNASRLLDRSNK